MARHACACVAMVLTLAGCVSRGHPPPGFGAATAAEALVHLMRIRRDWKGIRSFLKVQLIDPGGGGRFSARLHVDEDFRMQLDGMTPLGTVAFVLWVDGGDARFVNHLNRTSWTGSFAELSRSLGLGSEMSARDLISFLLGLPDPSQPYVSCDSPAGSDSCSADGVWRISMTPSGVSALERTGGLMGVRSEYLPPAFPPQRVEIRARNAQGVLLTQLNVEHIEVTGFSGRLRPPGVDSAYRCCFPPVFSGNIAGGGERP